VSVPTSARANVTYLLMSDINFTVVIERASITLDGLYHTVQGEGSGTGITVLEVENVTITRVTVKEFYCCIDVRYSSNNLIERCTVKGGQYGISLKGSSNTELSGNNINGSKVCGAYLYASSNNILSDHNVANHSAWGIYLYNLHFNVLRANTILSSDVGVELCDSNNNVISRNEVRDNWGGLDFYHFTEDNIITLNNITDNQRGIWFYYTYLSRNRFYHNNFIKNFDHRAGDGARLTSDFWDNGYPSGGNYWENYGGRDLYHGLDQNVMGCDGIGDSYHEIDFDIVDNYPLMGVFHVFSTSYGHEVTIMSNSSISSFRFDLMGEYYAEMAFCVSGDGGTAGFCRICIPRFLINGSYDVKLDGETITFPQVRELACSNETYGYLFITYSQSEHTENQRDHNNTRILFTCHNNIASDDSTGGNHKEAERPWRRARS